MIRPRLSSRSRAAGIPSCGRPCPANWPTRTCPARSVTGSICQSGLASTAGTEPTGVVERIRAVRERTRFSVFGRLERERGFASRMLGHSDDLVTGSRAFSPQASWPTPPARGVLSTHERTLDPHIAGGSGHQGSLFLPRLAAAASRCRCAALRRHAQRIDREEARDFPIAA